ncbi:MAG: flagellar hook-associated protein FlgL [Planctomycetota bacterium]
MRITQGHLYQRALSDIHRSLGKYTNLQQQVASGKRIEVPSDDPTAALRILPLQNDLRTLTQMSDNVALARESLDTGAASLEDGSALMQRVRELTMQASNGTFGDGDRSSIGAEMEQLLQQLVGIGNSRRGDRYLFGGTENGNAPFELVDGPGGTRVEYRGNQDRLQIEVAPGVSSALNLSGDAIFQSRDRRGASFTGDTGAAPTGRGDTAIGFQTLTVSFNGLHTDAPSGVFAGSGDSTAVGPIDYAFTTAPPTLSIGGGPAISIPASDQDFTTSDGRVLNLTVTGLPASLTGTMTAKAGLSTDGGLTVIDVFDFSANAVGVRSGNDGTVLHVDVTGLTKVGDEAVKHEGTFDAFTLLITLRDLLKNEDGADDATVRTRAGEMLAEIDGAHDSVLDGLSELGFRSSSMQVLDNRVSGLRVSREQSLSDLQDTDMAQAILELQRQDMVYQAALQMGSRVIQTSLQNFL